MNKRKKRLFWFSAVIAIAIFGSGAYAVASTRSGPSPGKGQPPATAPGVVAKMSHVDSLPSENPPADVVAFVQGVASRSGGDPQVAVSSLRELQHGLGEIGADLYEYNLGNGVPCFVLRGWAGACQVDETPTPGLSWLIAGGRTTPSGKAQPSALVGIVADNVQQIDLDVNGVASPVRVINNSFFSDLPTGDATVILRAVYNDGSTKSVVIPTSG